MVSRRLFTTTAIGALFGATSLAGRQQQDANYDEALVGRYTLPPLLKRAGGTTVRSPEQWQRRREELLDLFASHMYGHTPPGLPRFTLREVEAPVLALDGRAWRQQLRLQWPGEAALDVLVFRPRHERRVPVFVGLNYFGNHAVHPDPGILLSQRWMRSSPQHFIVNHRASEQTRGTMARRWPLDLIIERDCAVMTAYYGDLAPDDPSVVATGIAPLAERLQDDIPADQRWGAIGMWAWGLSQMREAASSVAGLDASRAVVIGHSRLGKAALWAGAQDTRFAMVVSNDSGEAGAALSRRNYGETMTRIVTAFPHWFCRRLASLAPRVQDLPFDQHALLALAAPRPLHVASAVEDRWADPRGEFLATVAADPVWRLHGARGLGVTRMPNVDEPVGTRVRYHVREGGHDITHYDWQQYLETARQQLG
jgi:hypothetical protein